MAERADFGAMLDGYKARREQDRETLERMLAYAQSGQCRWQLLLDDLDPSATAKRCGTCDNCRRIAAHEAAMAQPIVVSEETAKAAKRERMPFAESDPVKVKRFGAGVVVSSTDGMVTVAFEDGSRRCFHPDYVSRRRASRKKPAALAMAGAASFAAPVPA